MMAEALFSPNSSSELDEDDVICGICLEFYNDTVMYETLYSWNDVEETTGCRW